MHNLGLIFGAAGSPAIFAKEVEFNPIYNLESRDVSFLKTYKHNFPDATGYHVHPEELESFVGEHLGELSKADVIFSQPDCKAFSSLAVRKKDRLELFNLKNEQFVYLYKLIKIIKPKMFIVENLSKTFRKFQLVEKTLMAGHEVLVDNLPYHFTFQKLSAKTFGVPQERTRMFMIAQRDDLPGRFKFFIPKEVKPIYKDVIHAIQDLNNSSPNHDKATHSFEREVGFAKLNFGESYYGTQNNKKLFPDKISPTITSSKTQYVHPYEPRTLTARECARLMGFPDSFFFTGGRVKQLDQVGKAIVPQIAREILNQIRRYFSEIEF